MTFGSHCAQVDGLYRLMNGEHTGPINLGNPGALLVFLIISLIFLCKCFYLRVSRAVVHMISLYDSSVISV